MASVKEIEKNKVKIEFEISQDALKSASLQAYNKNKGKFSVPGFRKGHAPKAVIEKFYGEGVPLRSLSRMLMERRWTKKMCLRFPARKMWISSPWRQTSPWS